MLSAGDYEESSDDEKNISTLTSPGHRRYQQRSSSWSFWPLRYKSSPFFGKGQGDGVSTLKRRKRRSVTFDDCLTSDEVRQKLRLAPTETKKRSEIYEETARGEFRGHKRRGASSNETAANLQENPRVSDSDDYGADTSHLSSNSRRKHMRTVSKDDYLLARGANPRTGVVTPGQGIDQGELLRARGIEAPAQWRQRGDQWVSMDLDEPTPFSSLSRDRCEPRGQHQRSKVPSLSARQLAVPRIQNLRTPPRLAAGKHSSPIHSLRGSKAESHFSVPSVREMGSRSISEKQITNMQKEPRSGESGEKSRRGLGPQLATGLLIGKVPRKAVGSPPGKATRGNYQEHSGLTIELPPRLHERERSSSAPTPQTNQYYGPNNIGKNLPPLPASPRAVGQQAGDSPIESHREPFLGRRGVDWVEDVPAHWLSKTEGKGGSCLPMKSIPSQFHLSIQTRMRTPQSPIAFPKEHRPIENRRKPHGPRDGNPEYPYVRSQGPTIPPRHCPIAQEIHGGQRTMGFPSHVHPQQRILVMHPDLQPRSMRGKIFGPTTMQTHQSSQRDPLDSGTPTTPPSIIFTSIDTRTPSSTSTKENAQLPMMRTRPKLPPRPQMPDRGDGTTNVPKANKKLPPPPDECLWELTGTIHGLHEADLIPRALRPSTGSRVNAIVAKPLSDTDNQSPKQTAMSKSFVRCRVNSSDDRPPNIDGSIHISEDRASGEIVTKENTSPTIECSRPRLSSHERIRPVVCAKRCSLECNDRCEHILEFSNQQGRLSFVKQALKNLPPFKRGMRTLGSSPDRAAPLKTQSDSPAETGTAEPDALRPEFFWSAETPVTGSPAWRELANKESRIEGPPVTGSPAWKASATERAWVDGPAVTGSAARKAMATGKAPSPTVGDLAMGAMSAARRVISARESFSPAQATEARRVKGSATPRNVSWATVITSADARVRSSGNRNISSTSMASVKTIEVPGLGTVGDVLENLSIPFGAIEMWVTQHPQVMEFAKMLLARALEMVQCIRETGKKVYKVSYVYSKTGKVKVTDMGVLVRDCVRSVLYLLILGTVILFLVRVLRVVMKVGGWAIWVTKWIAWLVKNLGMGLLW